MSYIVAGLEIRDGGHSSGLGFADQASYRDPRVIQVAKAHGWQVDVEADGTESVCHQVVKPWCRWHLAEGGQEALDGHYGVVESHLNCVRAAGAREQQIQRDAARKWS